MAASSKNLESADLLGASVPHLNLWQVEALLSSLETRTPLPARVLAGDDHVWFVIATARVNRTVRQLKLAPNRVELASHAAEAARLRQSLLVRKRELLRDPENADLPAQQRSADTHERAITHAYELALHRLPAQAELADWKKHLVGGMRFEDMLNGVCEGPEAALKRAPAELPHLSDGEFIQTLYELVLKRAAMPGDIESWTRALRHGAHTRMGVLANLLKGALDESTVMQQAHDGLTSYLMGKSTLLHVDEWKKRHTELEVDGVIPEQPVEPFTRFHILSQPRVLVTAVASLYRGGDFIEQFMDNITSQSIFDDYCELIIVDAESPENEAAVIERYARQHPNVRYLRMNYRIGIYEAWNVGVREARGDYITNTNLDDLRRQDSLELQASVLDNLDFVDVAYQDFYISFDPRLTPGQVASFGYQSGLPVITPSNMMAFNSPHNAPMWRRRLHDEVGYFDASFKSAGDYEFWLRCLKAGKRFFKLNEPHVIYYQNPKGLSTRADTRGVVEARECHLRYSRDLVSPLLTAELPTFGRALGLSEREAASLRGELRDRYRMAQEELRQLARASKFPPEVKP